LVTELDRHHHVHDRHLGEFHTFYQERYTTLRPTDDRIMASSVTAQWLHTDLDTDWGTSYDRVLATLGSTFAGHYSLALQQTLYAIGEDIITEQPEIAEIRFSMPNKHHFLVDLSPFDVENKNEVFHADDRPYGYIEGTVRHDDAPDPGPDAFDPGQGW
jgi:urate oxidase